MRFLPISLALVACGAPTPVRPDSCPLRAGLPSLELGVAHVAGAYAPGPQRASFLEAGADDVGALGVRTLKLYLTPDYRTKYPQPWPAVRSLAELAATPAYRSVFARPFDTFVLTTSSFALGTGDPWRASDDPRLLEAEAAELEALTSHLLETYAGTGKRFVLQTWEGDWVLRAGGPEAPRRMIAWLEARQTGVTRARASVGERGVTVDHAVELNLVLRDERPSVVDDVLPFTCSDRVSYSAWEALEVDTAWPVATQRERIQQRLTRAVERISVAASGRPIALGEVGFAEKEHPPGATSALLEQTLATASALGVERAIYWQVYDNECPAPGDPSTCRGLWVVRPDGTASDAATTLRDFARARAP